MHHEDLLGKTFEPYEFAVEHGKIREFSTAVMATDPIHFDTSEAQRQGYRGVVAPPTFDTVKAHWTPPDKTGQDLGLDFRRVLAGGAEWQYFERVVASDILTVSGKVADVYRKEGRRGGMTMIVVENTFTNQRSVTAMICRTTIVELDDSPAEKKERA